MKKYSIILTLSFLLMFPLASNAGIFSWVAWLGYKKPTPNSWVQISGCYRIGVQNLNEVEKTIAVEAATIVCRVMHSNEFKTKITERQWRKSCGKGKEIAGEALADMLTVKVEDFSIYINQPKSASAQADPANNRIAIEPSRITSWASGEKKPMINSLAHEITHLISYEFKDSGHKKRRCQEPTLVSYGVGTLVSDLALLEAKQT